MTMMMSEVSQKLRSQTVWMLEFEYFGFGIVLDGMTLSLQVENETVTTPEAAGFQMVWNMVGQYLPYGEPKRSRFHVCGKKK